VPDPQANIRYPQSQQGGQVRDHTFNRPPRIRPHWAAERVELPEPPAPLEPTPTDWAQLVLPLAGAGIFASAASLGGGNPFLVGLPSGALALMGIGAALANRRAAARRAAPSMPNGAPTSRTAWKASAPGCGASTTRSAARGSTSGPIQANCC